jgi:hypothetical protein
MPDSAIVSDNSNQTLGQVGGEEILIIIHSHQIIRLRAFSNAAV